jgi:hypothetical protein
MSNLKTIRAVSVSAADISIYEKGIMHIHIKIKNSFSLEDAKVIIEARTTISKGKKFPVLYTSEYSFVTPSKEVTEYLSTPERADLIKAEAYVVRSFSQRLAAKTYLLIQGHSTPVSMFSSEGKALSWLERFI